MSRSVLVLFPGALGDFICLWPSLQVLQRAVAPNPITVSAKSDLFDLLDRNRFRSIGIERREIADLFAEGPLAETTLRLFSRFDRAYSWTGHGDANFSRRLRRVVRGDVFIYPFRDMVRDEHAADYYARCVGVLRPNEYYTPRLESRQWAEEFWAAHSLRGRVLLIHAGSGSRAKNWEGMAQVARWWRSEQAGQVVALRGPAEEREPSFPERDVELENLNLDRVAAVLERADLYLGNDSGISHLAGIVRARGVVVFGASDSATWRPLGDGLVVASARPNCHSCGTERLCTHRLSVASVCELLVHRRCVPCRTPLCGA